MTNEIHPHWQTNEDAQPVRVRAVERAPVAEATAEAALPRMSASRRPAAVVGIGVALLIGAFFIRGTGALLGQTADGATIRITKDGVAPAVATVHPGDPVTWKNDDAIPHILTSQTLQTKDGTLDTAPLFPGSSVTVTIAAAAKPGTYEYISTTSSTVEGQIIVEERSATPPPAPPAPAPQTPPPAPTPQEPAPLPEIRPDAPAPTPAGTIPRNPYTVDAPLGGGSALPGSAQKPPLASQEFPLSQPETGPALWIMVLGSIVLLAVITRRSLRRVTL